VNKGSLTPADIVCVAPDGTCTGAHPPSSELPFHRDLPGAAAALRADPNVI
jgi:L-fuculose-phosphate aldolase